MRVLSVTFKNLMTFYKNHVDILLITDKNCYHQIFLTKPLALFMIPHQKIQIKNLLTDSTTVIHQEIHDSWLVKYIKKY